MTTTAISRRPQPGEPRKAATGPTYSVLLPMLAALAVICASAALGGVLAGPVWFADIVVAALLIAVTGIVLRKLRVSGMVIPLVQLLVLLCLLVTMFTSSGMFVVLPGPSALGDLGGLLARSMDTIRTEVPPVHPAAPVLCLIVMLLGLVSVLVDLLVFTARAPAAAGLPLLCVYAVPASLDDAMLPWWSFVLGVAAFCLLLAADRARLRRQWRGRAGLPQRRTPGAASTAATVACLAMVVALIAGSAFTAVGTAGRLPGSGSGTGPAGQLGIKPFTTLRGLLDQGNKDTELFRVSGLAQGSHYLRALTLRDYLPNQGWVITQPMPRGVRPHGLLPTTQGVHERGPVTTVRIDPVNWTDVWLPVYGTPEVLGDVPIFWHYDAGTGIVYSERQRHPAPYTERTQLAEPSAQGLRKAGTDYHGINKDYLAVPPASSRVVALATRLTAGSSDPFDKASAIYRYFTTPSNGFTYSTRTAAATSSDALADFLFRGKTGFCEQYASAMAVLLREAGIPSRVGIGFTSGSKQAGGYRSITAKDAHAWVEVYFPGYGWQTFDPTPLADGRGYTPSYLSGDPSNGNDTLTAGKLGRTGQGASSGAQLSGKHAAPQPQAGHAIGSQPSTTF
ncbi:MAG: transglutaminaseTgpA domain-containing protein, partial [Sciscionella sp.]